MVRPLSFAVLFLLCLHPGMVRAEDLTIYHKTDAEGVLHLTDRRHPDLRVYMVFRGLLKRFPHVKPEALLAMVERHAAAQGVDPLLARAVAEVESGWKTRAVSSAGAQGVMQLMPDTQKDLGVRDPFDPDDNIRGGVRYLKLMLDRFGTVELALAAYNAGPGAVEKHKVVPPYPETQDYVRAVQARHGQLRAAHPPKEHS